MDLSDDPFRVASADMSLYKDLADAICLLAAVTKVAPEIEPLQETTVQPSGSNLDEVLLEAVDEHDDGVVSEAIMFGDKDKTTEKLKNELVDRLSEMLARYKSAPGPENRDARHVSSVIMVESVDRSAVTFICAKNEGLDSEDKQFLARWKAVMQRSQDPGGLT